MKKRIGFLAVFLLVGCNALAQAPPAPPAPSKPVAAQTPKLLPPASLTPAPAAPPAPPAPPAPNAPAPPPAPPAPPAAGSRQPINIKVDLTIGEDGGNVPAVKKTVSTVAGDGFSGSVRET